MIAVDGCSGDMRDDESKMAVLNPGNEKKTRCREGKFTGVGPVDIELGFDEGAGLIIDRFFQYLKQFPLNIGARRIGPIAERDVPGPDA
jgi:hypothetical protein